MKINTTANVSAAHVVHTIDTKCTRLHGHNWAVKVEINIGEGHNLKEVMPETQLLVDFTDIKNILMELDHKTIIAKSMIVDDGTLSGKILAQFAVVGSGRVKEYTLPIEDVAIIDVPAATAEWIAHYYATEIAKVAMKQLNENLEVTVDVFETDNCSASITVKGLPEILTP